MRSEAKASSTATALLIPAGRVADPSRTAWEPGRQRCQDPRMVSAAALALSGKGRDAGPISSSSRKALGLTWRWTSAVSLGELRTGRVPVTGPRYHFGAIGARLSLSILLQYHDERAIMAISEEARHQLYTRLEDVLGRREATTLMEHLPPVGWADVATKRDLDELGAATKRDLQMLAITVEQALQAMAVTSKRDADDKFAALSRDITAQGYSLRLEMAAMTSRVERNLRGLTLRMITVIVAVGGLTVAGARL